MVASAPRTRGLPGDPVAASDRLRAIGQAYLEFAREKPGLFATLSQAAVAVIAFAPHQFGKPATSR
jgi:hypothetical protein